MNLRTFIRGNLALPILLFILSGCANQRQISTQTNAGYNLKVEDLHIRDPFIIVSKSEKSYYLHANKNPHFKVYKSKDLKNWKELGYSFTADADFWGKSDFWAPDVYQYKGKYYMLATFSAPDKKRGTSFLVADHPAGPFKSYQNKAITPGNLMSLDAMLYVDEENNPWLIYCHEWLEAGDGRVLAQRLSADLRTTITEPLELFTASQAKWVDPVSGHGKKGYVTDGVFPYRAKNGELLMIWSSFDKAGKYAIGVLRSESGKITGPWKHDDLPLNDDDGGHAMLFRDFSGQLKISYHSPNSSGNERVKIVSVEEKNGQLKLAK